MSKFIRFRNILIKKEELICFYLGKKEVDSGHQLNIQFKNGKSITINYADKAWDKNIDHEVSEIQKLLK